ncbi:MAG TPA: hypothetical protein VN802_07435 [Stellaceae bacterium]|nr:hypothetical protein [Stellaceae bacterium]
MALPEDLLAQAKHLASKEPKKPKQASLRRAISAAYYALFHLLVADAARVMSPAQPPALRARVRRAFTHEDMKKACIQFRPGKVENLTEALKALVSEPIQSELSLIADAFVELQEARHDADYDTTQVFARADTLEKVEQANEAFAAWKLVRNEPNATAFLAALLLNRLWR